MKTEDHFAGLLNDDQMPTIENTDEVIKKYETYTVRMIDTKTRVLLPSSIPRLGSFFLLRYQDYRSVPAHRHCQIEIATWIGPVYYVYEA